MHESIIPPPTTEDLARWDRSLAEFRATPAGSMFPDRPLVRQVWYASEWLAERLANDGLSEEDRESILFAAGQTMAFRPDPWPYAAAALAKSRAGRPDEPGPELAEKLFRETFGDQTSPAR